MLSAESSAFARVRERTYNQRVSAARYHALLERIRAEFPAFRIVRKDRSRLQRAIHLALVIVTLGGMRRYLDGYQTTIGQTVYVTADWDERPFEERIITMRHELVHMRQFQRLTPLGMAVVYLLLPLPMGLAYGRARLEWEAYRETLVAVAELRGLEAARGAALRERIVSQFTGPSYGWMWPLRRQVERWYDDAVAAITERET
jgi:hypothetical protein